MNLNVDSNSGPSGAGGLNLPILTNNFTPRPQLAIDNAMKGAGRNETAASRTHGDSINNAENRVSRGKEIVDGSMLEDVNNGRSYADMASNRAPKRPDLPAHHYHALRPTKEGDQFSFKIPKDLLQKEIAQFAHALTGRLLLKKGKKPKTAMMVKKKLQNLWDVQASWKLIPLGKGYYTMIFNTAEDKLRVKAQNTWEVSRGHLRIREWTKNFDPFKEHSSLANVWVRIHYLPIEYWNVKVLTGIARFVGHPLRVDGMSAQCDFGQFARILIEIDMSKPLPNTLLVDGDDVAFHIEFSYESLPLFCSRCKTTGHTADKCRKGKTSGDEVLRNAGTQQQNKQGKQWQHVSGPMQVVGQERNNAKIQQLEEKEDGEVPIEVPQ
ncbi:uncharacterized protein LOC131025670 [Salvia miltiorrhiza]|uniref:uncharacterized protein LOC131025670 n=1 Tax=Salvia miltiorrhiza TaxID=226208 RepID=UPI0025ABB12B|nr:uncharacterized protein LOC131025670 [Salvia miltiorrhiza]